MIYKYIPLSQCNSNKGLNFHHVTNNRTTFDMTPDQYKLNWKPKEKVYFKKVRELVQRHGAEDIKQEEGDLNCDGKAQSTFRKIVEGVYIYTANLDTRNETVFIRLIAAIGKTMNKERLERTLFCEYDTRTARHISSRLQYRIQAYEMCENHKKSVGGWILSCQIPGNITFPPQKVRITFRETNKVTEEYFNEVCVLSDSEDIVRRKLKFGVCVPPLFGQIKAKSLIEFIEFNRILGASIFMLYVENSLESISMDVRQVIRYYERQNVVVSIPWQLPFPSDDIWYHGQSLVINDCLYRNMGYFEYLAFIDIDEFIVPQGDLYTWSDILNYLSQYSPNKYMDMTGMSFKSAFYSDEFSRRVFSNEMTMAVRTNRTKHFSYRRNKVIVRPNKIFELGIHHVSKPIRDSDSQNVINVPTSVAHIYHYRSCVKEVGIHCQVRIEDYSVPNKYGQSLIDNYLKTFFDITP